MTGWIKLHRKILRKDWFKNRNVTHFWLYCQLKATHKPFKATVGFQEVPLKPGQLIFGRKKAAEETGLSEREIRTCTKFLARNGTLTIKTKPNKFSIFTIINWAKYQGIHYQRDQQKDRRATNKRPRTIRRIRDDKVFRSAPRAQWLGFLSFWDQSFRKKYGFPYPGGGEKDRRRIEKLLLKRFSLELLQEAGKSFFESPDPVIQKSGYWIKDFYFHIDELIRRKNERR